MRQSALSQFPLTLGCEMQGVHRLINFSGKPYRLFFIRWYMWRYFNWNPEANTNSRSAK